MRARPVNYKEQLNLIMECRASGLSDAQWCMEHDIKPGTFYNWIKRLRKHPEIQIPQRTSLPAAQQQEVVQVVFSKDSSVVEVAPAVEQAPFDSESAETETVMEFSVGNATLKIPSGTNPALLKLVLQCMQESIC